MSREASAGTAIRPEAVERYLRRHGYPDARLLSLDPLGQDTQAGLKAYGYGRPLRATFMSNGAEQRLVIRTMSPDPFGHLRRADRVDTMVLSFDTFGGVPRHIDARDLGAFESGGEMQSVPPGEFFLVTNYVEGELYARDLEALEKLEQPRDVDVARARALARYLVELHGKKIGDALAYTRHLRDTVGAGEGIFGQTDAYPADPLASPQRLQAIERRAMEWRWKLRQRSARCCRTHGDFHPFNILFRAGDDFSVLDCSRGAAGEAADDVTCLSINYLFFALSSRGRFDGALRRLWSEFWSTYLAASNDTGLLECTGLYFAWRSLVVASPIWYPNLDTTVRDRLLRFGERALELDRFDPERIDELLR
jgi:aminoglycoside phosphotransferase (APT) family kinase protein